MELFFEREPKNVLVDAAMTEVINRIKKASGLNNIHGGYKQIKDLKEFIFPPLPLDHEIIEKLLSEGKSIWLCYVAVEIDPNSMMDTLIENPSMSDWDFEEQYVKPIVQTETLPVGAFKFGETKFRQIKFIAEF